MIVVVGFNESAVYVNSSVKIPTSVLGMNRN